MSNEERHCRILIRVDQSTRDRLDSEVAKHPDSSGVQASLCRAALRLYLTLTEGDLEAAENQIKRILGQPTASLTIGA